MAHCTLFWYAPVQCDNWVKYKKTMTSFMNVPWEYFYETSSNFQLLLKPFRWVKGCKRFFYSFERSRKKTVCRRRARRVPFWRMRHKIIWSRSLKITLQRKRVQRRSWVAKKSFTAPGVLIPNGPGIYHDFVFPKNRVLIPNGPGIYHDCFLRNRVS